MSGWNTIQKVRRLEDQLDALGFKFAKSRHSDWSEDHGAVSLVPKDNDALPMYSRDAELFVGSLEMLEVWLHGVEWARNYDRLCKISSDEKRAAAEQKERNRQLLRTLKEGKIVKGCEQ